MPDDDAEARIAGFLARYTPAVEAQLRGSRARLRAAFPRGYELVFDNYNALVFAIGPTTRTTDAFVSIAGYPRWVTLFFLRGIDLPDPSGILEGDGKQVRSVRLPDPSRLDAPDVGALIDAATRPHRAALDAAPLLETVVKSVAAKQRPRRPAGAA